MATKINRGQCVTVEPGVCAAFNITERLDGSFYLVVMDPDSTGVGIKFSRDQLVQLGNLALKNLSVKLA